MNKTRLAGWLLVASAIAVFGGQLVIKIIDHAGGRPNDGERPRSAQAVTREIVTGEFSLIDHRGNAVTDEDYRGSWLLVFFGYTHCPDVCPTTLGLVGLVMDELGADAAKVRPLFITVDPARDTPQIMADYVAAFHPRIIGLSGSPEQVKAATHSHRAFYAKAPVEEGGDYGDHGGHGDHGHSQYELGHGIHLYLMDAQGVYADAFSPTDGPEEIAKAIREFINE